MVTVGSLYFPLELVSLREGFDGFEFMREGVGVVDVVDDGCSLLEAFGVRISKIIIFS